MKIRYLALSIASVFVAAVMLFSSCRKINESTEIGGDLIPPVDNITTFDTLIDVQAFNDSFTFANDSQYLGRNEEFFLGRINNDPLFGKTDAQIFLELKPLLYGIYPFARNDSLKIDSIVLVLSYVETYGDTNTAQTLNVYELDGTNNFTSDSLYLIRKENFTYNASVPLTYPANQQIIPRNLDDSVKAFRDTTTKQLRLRLDTNLARRFMNYDTANAYKNDSIFNRNFKGFAIRSEGAGNAIMGFSLGDINTKLAIYYNHPKTNGGGARDTTVVNFFFSTLSAAANYVKRDYLGTPVAAAAGGTTPAPIVYLQNSPGTYANIKIPALSTLSNRVIHRAELIMEQLYDGSDTVFKAPDLLYVDAYDPAITTGKKYRLIPYDVVTDGFGSPQNLTSFGVRHVNGVDGSGNPTRIWKFNLSRYVQHVLTKTVTPLDLRVYAPFTVSNKYVYPSTAATDYSVNFNLNPSIAKGRIRLVGNTGDTNPHRMRLRLVYSKL